MRLQRGRFSAPILKARLRLAARPFAFAIALLATLDDAKAMGEDRWGWNYCPPPYPPTCVGQRGPKTAQDQACAKEVQRYIAAVFAYRACQSRELERAVSEANRVSNTMKCRSDKAYCEILK